MIIRTSRMAAVLALAVCAVAAAPAFATSNPPPAPAPSPAPSSSTSQAESAAAAAAAAAARAGAASRATGGQATGGAATGGRAVVGNVGSTSTAGGADLDSDIAVEAPASSSLIDSSRSSAWSLFLPPPVFTPPMAPVQCPSATITQDATSFVMGVYSDANAKTDTSDCTLIQVRNAKVEACQY